MDQPNDDASAARRKAVGSLIRALRGQRTQAELAKALGLMSQASVSAWENGLVEFTCEQVRAAEVALGVRLGTLGMAAGYVDPPTDVPVAPPGPKVLGRHWFTEAEDAYNAAKAAQTLFLGFRMWNTELQEETEDDTSTRWVVEVLSEPTAEPGLCEVEEVDG